MKAGSAQAESCCVYVQPEKFMQHMHDIIPKLFDCWADPVAHLLLQKWRCTANSIFKQYYFFRQYLWPKK